MEFFNTIVKRDRENKKFLSTKSNIYNKNWHFQQNHQMYYNFIAQPNFYTNFECKFKNFLTYFITRN